MAACNGARHKTFSEMIFICRVYIINNAPDKMIKRSTIGSDKSNWIAGLATERDPGTLGTEGSFASMRFFIGPIVSFYHGDESISKQAADVHANFNSPWLVYERYSSWGEHLFLLIGNLSFRHGPMIFGGNCEIYTWGASFIEARWRKHWSFKNKFGTVWCENGGI